MFSTEIKHLIAKDIRLELKQRYAINGILLYVVSTVFVSFLSFNKIVDAHTWNALFWIIMLFASVNAVSKSFVQENINRQLYYYTLASPQSIILSKILYNFIIMGLLSVLCLVVFIALMGSFITNYPLFITALLLGSFGFASILTMIAAIASRTNNNFALMAILSFPIVLPLLLTLIKVTQSALNMGTWGENIRYVIALLLINGIVIALSYILFPYLWRD
jgi:heme exporter protein B